MTNQKKNPAQTTAHKKKKSTRFHKDLTTFNVVIAILTVMANIAVIYTMFNSTQFSGLGKSTFILANVLCLIILLVMNFMVMIGIRSKKKTLYVSSVVFMCIMLGIGGFGTYALFRVNSSLGKMTSSTSQESVSTSLVVYSDTGTQTITDMSQLDGAMVGYATGTKTADLGQQELSSNSINATYKEYQDYSSEMLGLLNGEIECAILPSNYQSMFANETGLADYLTNCASIKDFESTVTVENSTSTSSNKDLTTEPFTVLLIGNADGLSDTIIIVSVNPISMKITMTSIARDSYVPITCYNNAESKINAAHSVSRDCLISTVEQLTGISIDYYVDTNFQGVVDVVDALGGIVVDSPVEFVGQSSSSTRGTYNVWVPAGDNVVLNGEQALAFARERHAFATGDFARQEHQQEVIKAMIRSIMRTRDVNTFLNVVDAAGDNIQTNLSVEQMSGFVSYAMKKVNRYYDQEHVENVFNIVSSRLTGYNSGVWDEGLQLSLSIVRIYQGSITDTKAAVDRNTDMTSTITAAKSTKWSVNWDFTVPSISADEYNETKIESTVPTTIGNYVGKSLSTLQSWADANNIAVYATDENGNTATSGTIVSQDIASGTSISDFSAVTVVVSGGTTATASTETTTNACAADQSGTYPDCYTPVANPGNCDGTWDDRTGACSCTNGGTYTSGEGCKVETKSCAATESGTYPDCYTPVANPGNCDGTWNDRTGACSCTNGNTYSSTNGCNVAGCSASNTTACTDEGTCTKAGGKWDSATGCSF